MDVACHNNNHIEKIIASKSLIIIHIQKVKACTAATTSCISFFLSFFWSGLRGSKAYSLWGGVIPSPSIGYDYL